MAKKVVKQAVQKVVKKTPKAISNLVMAVLEGRVKIPLPRVLQRAVRLYQLAKNKTPLRG